jgi:threonine aldolase
MAALAAANTGHVFAYGDDPVTGECNERFNALFRRPVDAFMVWGGTGANIVGLAPMLRSSDAVVCSEIAHIHIDEGGAAERLLGTKLLCIPTSDGKITPHQIVPLLGTVGDPHHVQPRVISITQSTELGAVYSAGEVTALADFAHANAMYLHMDGARIANATASLGGDIRTFTVDAGVDVLSFGGTKNGMMYGEAVVVMNPELTRLMPFFRKQLTQLPSKARFISAQFNALLADDLWLSNARHANAMAGRLYERTYEFRGVEYLGRPPANALFPVLPADIIDPLRAWCPFYPWNPARNQVRWVTNFDTTESDVDTFSAGLETLLEHRRAKP